MLFRENNNKIPFVNITVKITEDIIAIILKFIDDHVCKSVNHCDSAEPLILVVKLIKPTHTFPSLHLIRSV